jgi:hypothetical protein
MKGIVENIGGISLLDDDTCVHHIDAIGDIRYHSKVMSDVEEGHMSFLLELFK